MSSKIEYVSKTQHYLKVKKPLIERQRRARINKHLDALKLLIAEFQGDDAIMRMDKAEMLEATIAFMRTQSTAKLPITGAPLPVESFRHGYMNAVNEVSRVMAATPGMSVNLGKAVMTHLGFEFNRLLHCEAAINTTASNAMDTTAPLSIDTASSTVRAASPASSGYHSDCDESPMASPLAQKSVWRPW